MQEIFANLRRNKLRTALTGLSVSVGIFLLIVLLGAGNGLIHAFEHNAGNMALDVVRLWPGFMSKPYDGLGQGHTVRFDNRDLRLTSAGFPGRVLRSTGELSQGSVRVTAGSENATGELRGVFADYADMNKVVVTDGRFVSPLDLSERRKVMVVGRKTAADLFGDARRAVGRLVVADSTVFRIVGVYADRGQMGSLTAYVPFTTLQLIYNKGVNVESILMRTRGVDTEEADETFRADLRRSMGALHRFAPDDESAIWVYNSTTGAKESAKAMGVLRTALWLVGLLTLLSGVVGISNIMLITVKERTREFGIRKALGAKPRSILGLIIAESVAITTFFGYIGMVAGIGATEWMNAVFGNETVDTGMFQAKMFANPTVDIGIALQATLTLVVAGTLAGVFPARKATKIKPIEALRAE